MNKLREFVIGYLVKSRLSSYSEGELHNMADHQLDYIFCSIYQHLPFINYIKGNKDFILKECWNSGAYNGFLKIAIDYVINYTQNLSEQDIEYICKMCKFRNIKTPFSLLENRIVPERIIRQYSNQFYMDEIFKYQKISFRFAWLMRKSAKINRLYENNQLSKRFKSRFLRMIQKENEML